MQSEQNKTIRTNSRQNVWAENNWWNHCGNKMKWCHVQQKYWERKPLTIQQRSTWYKNALHYSTHSAKFQQDTHHQLDADIIIMITLSCSWKLNQEGLWVKHGTGIHRRWIPVHLYVACIGPEVCEALPLCWQLFLERPGHNFVANFVTVPRKREKVGVEGIETNKWHHRYIY